MLSAGGFFTVTAYSTGWVTHVSLAPATETTGGSSTFFGAHCGSVVSLPIVSTQKLLQAFGVTSRYRTHFEENSKPRASIGFAPAQSTSFIAYGFPFLRAAMKGTVVPGAIWMATTSAEAAARSRSATSPAQPASCRTASTSALAFSERSSTRRSSPFFSGFAKRVAGLPRLVALCCWATAGAVAARASAAARVRDVVTFDLMSVPFMSCSPGHGADVPLGDSPGCSVLIRFLGTARASAYCNRLARPPEPAAVTHSRCAQ